MAERSTRRVRPFDSWCVMLCSTLYSAVVTFLNTCLSPRQIYWVLLSKNKLGSRTFFSFYITDHLESAMDLQKSAAHKFKNPWTRFMLLVSTEKSIQTYELCLDPALSSMLEAVDLHHRPNQNRWTLSCDFVMGSLEGSSVFMCYLRSFEGLAAFGFSRLSCFRKGHPPWLFFH